MKKFIIALSLLAALSGIGYTLASAGVAYAGAEEASKCAPGKC